jgi:GNAT superfamily N-acetyltransferase
MFDINLIEWVGYGASVLVAVSLLMSSIIRLRWYNTAGSILFSIYGYVIGALPVAIINSFIIIINIYYLYRLHSEKENFKIMKISKDESYLINFFSYFKDDIKRLFPDFELEAGDDIAAYTVLRNMVPAGILVGKRQDEDTLFIALDYVTPLYRDFKIGHYLFVDNKQYFKDMGYNRFSTKPSTEAHNRYLKKMGFVEIKKGSQKLLIKEND